MKALTNLTKYIGLLLIVLGTMILFTSKSSTAEVPLLVGLFTLFISNQKREDEGSGAIRSSSAFFALIIGYTIKLIITYLYSNQIITFNLTSINYFLIIVFSLANVIRYSRLYIFMA
ncbi:hypothetical protein [Pedobacter foliorum]|uniref:hypothetical protein n=1 Tax=Pedobacter foliorum TaxID=2739058 RepID=UPI0015650EE1|nr:hypothetical protein [Pedobacter foliorum]NRF38163.1 hypothetical protein [Pedobacter foliorum]